MAVISIQCRFREAALPVLYHSVPYYYASRDTLAVTRELQLFVYFLDLLFVDGRGSRVCGTTLNASYKCKTIHLAQPGTRIFNLHVTNGDNITTPIIILANLCDTCVLNMALRRSFQPF